MDKLAAKARSLDRLIEPMQSTIARAAVVSSNPFPFDADAAASQTVAPVVRVVDVSSLGSLTICCAACALCLSSSADSSPVEGAFDTAVMMLSR